MGEDWNIKNDPLLTEKQQMTLEIWSKILFHIAIGKEKTEILTHLQMPRSFLYVY